MSARQTIVAAAFALVATAPVLPAQVVVPTNAGWQLGASYEQWNFGCCTTGAPATSVQRATEWTVPFTLYVPIGDRVMVDAYAAWMRGEVTFRDATVSPLHLDGVTDTRVRASIRMAGDALLATVGVNIPTGSTSLDADELGVLDVVGAPALRYQTPILGTGWGGTAGLVYTARVGTWGLGLGASYEYRGQYSPAQAAALGFGSIGNFNLRPGQAMRVSIGTNGLAGQSAMTASVSSTFYTQDHVGLSAGGGTPPSPITLGPMVTAEWELRAATSWLRELEFYAFDRYRFRYRRSGQTVAGTEGNELEGGVHTSAGMSRTVAFLLGLRGRYHTGLSIDTSLPTAGIVSGGGDIGLSITAGRIELRPAVGGEIGSLHTGVSTVSLHKLEATFTIAGH